MSRDERLLIRVPEVDSNDAITLTIKRGAFGSGEHETTRSCLDHLWQLREELSDARVLDLGSGTAVLAIAALKLGAASAVCIDPNAKAIDTGRHNCEYNGVVARVTHVCGTLTDCPESQFNFILANLYSDILIAEAPELSARSVAGATLLQSGISWEDLFLVEKTYQRLGWRKLRTQMLEEYASMVWHKA